MYLFCNLLRHVLLFELPIAVDAVFEGGQPVAEFAQSKIA
jgi:hypothetical protein